MTHCYWTEHREEWPSDRAQFLEEIGLQTDPLEVRNVTRADLAVAMHEVAIGCNFYCATSGVLATNESRARHFALHLTQAAAVFAALPQIQGRSVEIPRLLDLPKLTADEFAETYAARSGVTLEWLRENGRSVARCDCGEDGCEGWQMAHVRELQWAADKGIASPLELRTLADAKRRMP